MSNLDDFFAKKDKKKKTKKGFSKANTEILAKNLEEQDRKEAKADEKTAGPLATSEVNRAQAAIGDLSKGIDDEWKEYDDGKKDYSNLKIEALKVGSDTEEQEEEEHEINEEGEKVRIKKTEGGPWNKTTTEGESSDTELDEEQIRRSQKAIAKAELESSIGAPKGSVVGGSYVPPHMRSSGGSASTGPSAPRGLRKTKHAPDINSEIYFPSLSSAVGPGEQNRASNERDFEEVKGSGGGGYQHTSSRASETPRLALDNKFAALRN